MSDEVRIRDEQGVRWLELSRPDSKNGLTPEVNALLFTALEEVNALDDIRVVVIAGTDGNFCSGLDLKHAVRMGPQTREQTESHMRDSFHRIIRAIRAVDGPVIAAVDGPAAGFGCDLALACDIRLVSERASFGELFVRRGLMPDGGGTMTLPMLVGVGRALELMFTGDTFDAAEAYRLGIANRVFAAAEFDAAVAAFASKLAAGAPLSHKNVKRAVYASWGGSLDDALEREVQGQLECIHSNDFIEGVAAFLQKREPSFKGR